MKSDNNRSHVNKSLHLGLCSLGILHSHITYSNLTLSSGWFKSIDLIRYHRSKDPDVMVVLRSCGLLIGIVKWKDVTMVEYVLWLLQSSVTPGIYV